MRPSLVPIALVALSLVPRLVIWSTVPPGSQVIQTEYLFALSDHFDEYVLANTLKPPLTYAIHASVVALAGVDLTLRANLLLLLSLLGGTAAAALVFGAAVKLGADRRIAFAVTALYSVALIPFELWRGGSHFDHLTIPLAALFMYSCTGWLRSQHVASGVTLGLAGALLVAQAPSALYVVPATVVASAVAVRVRSAGSVSRRSLIAALVIPAIVGLTLVAKNYGEARVFATGNQTGSTLMIFAHEALRSRPDAAALIVAESDAPRWYRWCYENAIPPPGLEDDPAWRILARAFGLCVRWTEASETTWPFDLTALRAELVRDEEWERLRFLDRDIADMRERRWLLAGYGAEQTLRWAGIYGEVSPRIAARMLRTSPTDAASTLLTTHARYVYRGALLTHRTLEAPSENGMRTLSTEVPGSPILRPATLVFAALVATAYLALPVVFAWTFLRWRRDLAARRVLSVLLPVAVPVWLLAAIFTVATWDVDRYFLQSTPYLVVAASLMMSEVVALLRSSSSHPAHSRS